MTPEQEAKIRQLAEIAHAKEQQWLGLSACNTSTDPVEARRQRADYRVAEAEWFEAETKCRQAMQP